jgi:putative peptide zinc metalloprotease protein
MLAPLREELSIFPGPAAPDGAPSWTLHDPVRNSFFRLGWKAFEILARWQSGGPGAICRSVNRETVLRIDDDDVFAVADFLVANQLVSAAAPSDTSRLMALSAAARRSWFRWLLHNYLFLRIPLFRPDRLLDRTRGLAAWAYSGYFAGATLIAWALGIFLISRQWDVFRATLVDTLTPRGLVQYGLALTFVKAVHEFAHACTAKHFGCRVPTMGIAFLVLWPVPYTDVTACWRLKSRRQRLAVGAAGIVAELVIAAWCTLLWAILPDGPVRQMAFMLAAITWVSSLVINLSPFMRFDGYFLLMDALDVPNLHQRSFDMARWWLREALFDLREDPPEQLGRARDSFLILFAFAVWLYRLAIFVGIAVLVYHFFIKAVGIMLFGVEISWFVVVPITRELKAWWGRRASILARGRAIRSCALATLALLAFIIPWRGEVRAPAMLKATDAVALYLPTSGDLVRQTVQYGQRVKANEPIFVFSSADLQGRRALIEARIRTLQYQIRAAAFDNVLRAESSALRDALAASVSERDALLREADRLTILSPNAGTVVDILPNLQPGDTISPHDRLAILRSDGPAIIDAYVKETDLARVQPNDRATFYPDTFSRPAVAAHVLTIDRVTTASLTEAELAQTHGGGIAVRGREGAPIPDGAIYRVRLVPDAGLAAQAQIRGVVSISGRTQSVLAGIARSAAAVLVREWGA